MTTLHIKLKTNLWININQKGLPNFVISVGVVEQNDVGQPNFVRTDSYLFNSTKLRWVPRLNATRFEVESQNAYTFENPST
jgi:hypothetical protein